MRILFVERMSSQCDFAVKRLDRDVSYHDPIILDVMRHRCYGDTKKYTERDDERKLTMRSAKNILIK